MAAEESTFPEVDPGPVSSETLSDAELIAATRAGDAGSFAVLYTRHVDAARACARRLVRSRSEADDLVAEGFAKVLGALRKGKGPDLAFRPYLLTSVRNALYDRTRRDRRIEFTDETPEPVNAVLLGADYEREDRAMVAQAYAALPERWQMVLWHTDVEGRAPAEIAPLLGISANSVAALAYRAREGLRQAYLNAHVNRGVSDGCRSTTEKLSAYVRDGLSARDRRAVQEHLDGCAGCTALLAELEEANRSLKVVLLPVLAGVSASAYLSGLSGGGIVRLFRRNPSATGAAAVAAVAAIVVASVAMASPGGADDAQALTVPPIGSGRPTTTTTTTTTTTSPPATTSAAASSTLAPFTPPTFDTAVPPRTYVPYDPDARTVTTVRRRTTTTTRPRTVVTQPRVTTTEATTTTTLPPDTATTTTSTTTTTTVPATTPPVPPALTSKVTGLGPVYAGQSAYFSVNVANASSGNGGSARKVAVGPAEGVVVSFDLPAGASFIGASSPDWACDVAGTTVRCLLPRLDPGVATEATFTIDVPPTATGDLEISPTVVVNGQQITAPTVTRPIQPGANIADFIVAPGAELVVAGNTLVTCDNPDLDCAGGGKEPLAPSQANLTLGGATLERAYLIWHGSGTADSTATLTAPGATPAAVQAPDAMVLEANGAWVATAEVTDLLRGDGIYEVSDVTVGSDGGDYAGWALVAVISTPGKPARGVAIQRSVAVIDEQAPTATVSFKGIPERAPNRRVEVAVLVGEGDSGPINSQGESLALVDEKSGVLVELSTDLHPADGNVFRSRVIRHPDAANAWGTDLDVYGGTIAGAQPLRVRATTGHDQVWISAVVAAFDL